MFFGETPLSKTRSIALCLIILINSLLSIPDDWNHGCSRNYNRNGNMVLDIPKEAEIGDLLMLFLSRTDDYLPLDLKGWKYGGSCFKTGNGQKRCYTRNDCKKLIDGYCYKFPRGRGKDLATVIFYKRYRKYDYYYTDRFKFRIVGDQPGWGFLLAVKGVDTANPIRERNGTSADNSTMSIFPSVKGTRGDLLLLSMAFDDKTQKNYFLPPKGTKSVNFVKGEDEAGYLFAKAIELDGDTGELESEGIGGPINKDALISLVLKSRLRYANVVPKFTTESPTTASPSYSPTSIVTSNPTALSTTSLPTNIITERIITKYPTTITQSYPPVSLLSSTTTSTPVKSTFTTNEEVIDENVFGANKGSISPQKFDINRIWELEFSTTTQNQTIEHRYYFNIPSNNSLRRLSKKNI